MPPARNSGGAFTWGPSYAGGYQNYSFGSDFASGPDVDKADEPPVETEPAVGGNSEPVLIDEENNKGSNRRSRRLNSYDQDVAPDWLGAMRSTRNDEAVKPEDADVEMQAAPTLPSDQPQVAAEVDPSGRIVVLSVDEPDLSHSLAFDLARRAAGKGNTALFLEVFPEQVNARGAEGFSDIVSGAAPFAKVVYRDAGSRAHIIEAGRVGITDEMVESDRFKLALDAMQKTYHTIVVDLGAIDGTLASARMLSFADRVLIAADGPDHNHELESAANLLAHNTGADVEIVIQGGPGSGPRRNGDGHAA